MKHLQIIVITFAILKLGLISHASGIAQDREYWIEQMLNMATPILTNMGKGELKKNMTIELSPTWDNRNSDVAYMESFARLMLGISPWLALDDDNTHEGIKRKEIRDLALKCYKNAIDPSNPDYLLWKGESQVLVDAAFIANSFIRAPKALWEPLDDETKKRYITEFKNLRNIKPSYSNWLLFRAMIEAFFVTIDEPYDGFVLDVTMRKMNEWYLGDGCYSDGTESSFDYYNAYVIHPMIVEITEIMEKHRIPSVISFNLALRRMQRYNQIIERMISPEATYPAVGRSMTYRLAAFHSLALSAWKYGLPETINNGQTRNAMTCVMKKMFSVDGNFDKKGFLTLGFVGHQPNLADYYTNNGSTYLTSVIFLPLGLSEDSQFWSAPPEPWTQLKAWNGEKIPKDYHQSIVK